MELVLAFWGRFRDYLHSLASSSLILVAIVGCTDGRTVVVPRRPFCLPLGKTGVPAPGGTFLLDNYFSFAVRHCGLRRIISIWHSIALPPGPR